jgi:hypothetical protein
MPPLLQKLGFTGCAARLFIGPDRKKGLETAEQAELALSFAGIAGDCHGGLTRLSDSRTLAVYRRNVPIRNVRQVTLVAVEELAAVAAALGVPVIEPEWLGANVLTTGIPDLSLLPPSTRLQFPSGATLVVDMENRPCRLIAETVGRRHPETEGRLVAAAHEKRGLTAWVEREGRIMAGDAITLFLPPQRIYPHP